MPLSKKKTSCPSESHVQSPVLGWGAVKVEALSHLHKYHHQPWDTSDVTHRKTSGNLVHEPSLQHKYTHVGLKKYLCWKRKKMFTCCKCWCAWNKCFCVQDSVEHPYGNHLGSSALKSLGGVPLAFAESARQCTRAKSLMCIYFKVKSSDVSSVCYHHEGKMIMLLAKGWYSFWGDIFVAAPLLLGAIPWIYPSLRDALRKLFFKTS